MSLVTSVLTYEDLCRQRDDGNRYELIDGELVMMAGPSPKHQFASLELAFVFRRAVFERGLGFVFHAPLDVRLPPANYVQPDVLVVLRARAHIIGPALIDGAPDIVAEITSASSATLDRTRKLALYARAGVREYWLVELQARRVVVYADAEEDRYRRVDAFAGDDTARSTVVPGLEVTTSALFSGLPTDE